MDEKKDYTKLKSFVEAACTNPLHPIYKLGMSHSVILQHYAVNVMMLETVKPDQWFSEYPRYTQRLEEVMALCEVVEPEKPAEQPKEEAKPEPEPVAEAAQMMDVKCPKCGAEFNVPMKGA